MSPIFVRPVREQLEHDRLIRFLQTRYKRKFDAAMNVGDEQIAPVKLGANTFFPDLVLTDGKKLAGLVEVETGESVNNLEAMAQWVHFSRARVPFHLYVPVQGYDAARRLCAQHRASVTEIWTYRASMDGFDLVRMFHDASAVASGNRESRKAAASQAAAPPEKRPARPAAAAPSRPARPGQTEKAAPATAARNVKGSKSSKPAKPVSKAAAKAPAKPAAKPARKGTASKR